MDLIMKVISSIIKCMVMVVIIMEQINQPIKVIGLKINLMEEVYFTMRIQEFLRSVLIIEILMNYRIIGVFMKGILRWIQRVEKDDYF